MVAAESMSISEAAAPDVGGEIVEQVSQFPRFRLDSNFFLNFLAYQPI